MQRTVAVLHGDAIHQPAQPGMRLCLPGGQSMYQRVVLAAGCRIASIAVWIYRMTRLQMGSELTEVEGLMTVGLDTFGCLDEAFDFILIEAGFLDVAEQIHYFGLVMKIADNFRVGGRGQAE